MDSINVYSVIDVLWAVMIGHMAVGLVWAKVPALSQLYPKAAAAYAHMAMEEYVKAKADPSTDAEVLETHEKLARISLERAAISLDYHSRQRKFFINMLWVTELRWTLECLRGIGRLKT